MFKETADIKTADQLNLPTPKAIYMWRRPNLPSIKKPWCRTFLNGPRRYMRGLTHISTICSRSRRTGRKLGLDQRLINPMLPDNPDSKVNMCVNNISASGGRGRRTS